MAFLQVNECRQCGKKGVFLTLHEGDLCTACYRKIHRIEPAKTNDIERKLPERTPVSISIHEKMYDFMVIDVETTGLNAGRDKVIQIAAVRFINQREVSHFVSYVNPEIPIPQSASNINGITDNMVKKAPLFSIIQKRFFDFIELSPFVVGYNVDFDLKFLSAESNMDLFNQWEYADVLSLARNTLPGLPGYKLSEVCRQIQYTTDFHDALSDCRACGEVLNYLYRNSLLQIRNGRLLPKKRCGSDITEERIKAAQRQKEREEERKRKEIEEQLEYEAYLKALEERRKAFLAEWAEWKAKEPPAKELHQQSLLMTGTVSEYFSKVQDILSTAGRECSDIKINCASNELRYKNGLDFFGVKLEGRLRYITLYITPRLIHCDYICTVETQTKGEGYCRIYIPSPDAIDSISRYVIAAFDNAQKEYDSRTDIDV